MTDKTIGEMVRWCARKQGKKMVDIARTCGVSHSYLDTMLRNEKLQLKNIERIAGVLGVTPASLIMPAGTPPVKATRAHVLPRETVYTKVRVLLAVRGWSLERLAERMDVSRQAIQKALASGKINLGHLRDLSEILDTTPQALLSQVTKEDWVLLGKASI